MTEESPSENRERSSARVRLRMATVADFVAYFNKSPPRTWCAMCGVIDGTVVGIGGVVYSDDGVAIGFLDTDIRPRTILHRGALRFLDAMRKVGEPVIQTWAQEDVPSAEPWLKRLGFRNTRHRVDGKELWTWFPR